MASIINGLEQGGDDRLMQVGRAFDENVQNLGGQAENREVANVVADMTPSTEQAGDTIAPRFSNGGHVFIRSGEA